MHFKLREIQCYMLTEDWYIKSKAQVKLSFAKGREVLPRCYNVQMLYSGCFIAGDTRVCIYIYICI
jgi:hypothetical protein